MYDRAQHGGMDHGIVTGGSRGIGRAIALALGRTGAAVTVNYRSDADAAQRVVKTLSDGGSRATAVQADVTDPDQVRRLLSRAEAELGRPDVLVVNAGMPGFAPVDAVTPDEFDRVFAAPTRATFTLLQEGARRLADGGRIVVVSSGAAASPGAGGALYGATKVTIDYWAAVLSKELGPRGITVNSVMPGLTDTDGMIMPTEAVESMVAATPLGRIGQPHEIAAVVAFLAGDDAGWVTGQRIGAAGGLV
jgi:3-oxoacyl-[acyl-carrier protein] reductase